MNRKFSEECYLWLIQSRTSFWQKYFWHLLRAFRNPVMNAILQQVSCSPNILVEKNICPWFISYVSWGIVYLLADTRQCWQPKQHHWQWQVMKFRAVLFFCWVAMYAKLRVQQYQWFFVCAPMFSVARYIYMRPFQVSDCAYSTFR